MDWLLVCPMCACIVQSFGSLRTLEKHYRCALCRTDYEAKLDDYITVTFTVSSKIRPILFHNLDELDAREYCFECRLTPDGMTPDGDPGSPSSKRPPGTFVSWRRIRPRGSISKPGVER